MRLKLLFFASAARRLKAFKVRLRHSSCVAVAVGLALLIFSAPLGVTVSAYTPASNPSDNDYFLIYEGDNGDTVCREANQSERLELEKITPKNLRQINHISADKTLGPRAQSDNSSTNLTIILRATTNLDNNPVAKAAFIRAAAAWEAIITSPMTIYLDADYGPDNFGQSWPDGVLGSTSSPSLSNVSYTVVRNNLIAGANTPAKQAVYNALPSNSLPIETSSGTSSASSVSVSSSIARAIGLLDSTAQPTDSAARIGFNSTRNFDFDRSNGISGTDFESVAVHEIGHALGFTSRSGSSTPTPAVWDLYRFRSGTTSGTFTNAPRVMTIGGPVSDPLQYYFVPGESQTGLSNGGPSGSSDNNADGNQSSHWKQASLNGGYIGIMDPRIPSGTIRPITNADINALNIFGYNSNAVPPPPQPANDNFVSAQAITGCSGSVTGTNVGATRESGEPNHSPDNGGGNRSVWYAWQAPASTNVTFTTAGSGFDTVLGVYIGNSVGSLSPIEKADDNSSTDKTSTVTFTAAAGAIYRIAVDGYNNGGAGGDVGPVTLNWTAATCGSSAFSFSQTGYVLNENVGSIMIMVNRIGDNTGQATVNYATGDTAGLQSCSVNNGIASERCDYATTVGTLRFASGQSSNTFFVPIIDDVLIEGTEAFTVTLSAPAGATLGATHSVSVTIQNNDANAATPNPIDGVNFFVTQQYIDFLSRLPDSTGLANWTATLGNCPNGGFGENLNPNCDRVHVSSGFFLSVEFQQRGYFAYRFYEVALDRRPTYAEFVPDMALVGGPQSPESEALSKTAYTQAWTQRPEFTSRYDSLSNSAYVNALEANAEVTLSNKAALIAALDGGQTNRGQVLRDIVESQAVANRFFNRAFVSMQYFGYLRRDPDTVGFNNWLTTLNNNPADFRHMIFGFLFSTEYRQRFGP